MVFPLLSQPVAVFDAQPPVLHAASWTTVQLVPSTGRFIVNHDKRLEIVAPDLTGFKVRDPDSENTAIFCPYPAAGMEMPCTVHSSFLFTCI